MMDRTHVKERDVDAEEWQRLRHMYDIIDMVFHRKMRVKDVALELGLTRGRVSKLRDEAIARGIVRVEVDFGALDRDLTDVARALQARYPHVKRVRVIPDTGTADDDALLARLGQAAADHLVANRLIANGRSIGFGPGAHLSYLAHALPDLTERVRLNKLTVYPLVATYVRLPNGTIIPDCYPFGRGAGFVASEAANRLRHGPKGPAGIEARPVFDDRWGADAGGTGGAECYRGILDEISESGGFIVTAATSLDESGDHAAPLCERLLSRLRGEVRKRCGEDIESLEQIRRLASVVSCGRFYDLQGGLVSCRVHRYISAASLEYVSELQRAGGGIAHVLITGSTARSSGADAILCAKTVTDLVTDLSTARELLDERSGAKTGE